MWTGGRCARAAADIRGGDECRVARLVTEILDNARYTEDVGKRLHAVAAEFARLAGMLAYDNNNEALAQRYLMAGLHAAHSSGDRAVGANILGFMSKQARDHDPRDAIRLAELLRRL